MTHTTWITEQILWTILKDHYPYKDEDIIYIVENDYVHASGWVDVLVELYKKYNALLDTKYKIKEDETKEKIKNNYFYS